MNEFITCGILAVAFIPFYHCSSWGVIFCLSMVAWAVMMAVQGEWLSAQEYLPFLCGLVLIAGKVTKGQWHRLESLESGTVIVEMKDGAYEPVRECDVLK